MKRKQRGFLMNPFRFGGGGGGGGGGEGYSTLVKLLLHGNGADASTTFTDSSLYGHTVTSYGNAQIDTGYSKYGGAAMLFDGVGDYLDVVASNEFYIGTGNFTIEFWIRTTFNASGASISPRILAPIASLNTAGVLQIWQVPSVTYGNTVNGVALGRPDGTGYIVSTHSAINDGGWHHIAVSRESGTSRMFLDGNLEESASDTNSYTKLHTDGIRVGGRSGLAAGSFFTGSLDDLRVINTKAIYTAAFSAPTSELTDPTFGAVSIPINYLVIAGGGSGGKATTSPTPAVVGAGGGAGGYVAGAAGVYQGVDYHVVVGAGGSGATVSNGGDSALFGSGTVFSVGGGFGADRTHASGAGGSGGGGSYQNKTGGAATAGQGSAGGTVTGYAGVYVAAGGGGAGAAGGPDYNTPTYGSGSGGDGLQWLDGNYYAGGGGGGRDYANSPDTDITSGGNGGGGGSSTSTADYAGQPGTANTGGGGGGGSINAAGSGGSDGGNGGAGVVIIRYADTYADAASTTGSPTYTNAGGYKTYKFTGSGSITF